MPYNYQIIQNKIKFNDSIQTNYPIPIMYNNTNELWTNFDVNRVARLNSDFKLDTNSTLGTPNCTVKNLFCDQDHNYWIGSEGCGVFYYSDKRFLYYGTKDGLYSNSISNIATYANDIYVSYNNNTVQSLYAKKCYQQSQAIFSREIKNTCLLSFKDYIVTGGIEPMVIYNRKNGIEIPALGIKNIKCSHKWGEDAFLVGNSARCYRVELPNKITDTIFYGRTTAVYPRNDGSVLIGTLHRSSPSNLYVFSKNRHNQQWISDSGNTYPMLKGISISCIEEVNDILIIGTVEKGLMLVKDKKLEQVKLEQNAPNVNCRKVLIDEQHNIWLATYSGIYKIVLGKGLNDYSVQKIKKRNGLLSDYISDILLVGDSVYVASSEGLTLFSKSKWNQGIMPPALWINEVFVNNRSYPFSNHVLCLPHDSNSIEFNFSAIDFKSMGNVQFKYRLMGLKEDWQYGDQNSVRYPSLAPGNYTFEVMALNAYDVWSVKAQKFNFRISPPWWRSNWFSLLSFLSIMIILVLIVKKILQSRHQKELESLLQKKQVTELELKAIKAQINPHFLFNALNSIQCFINEGKNELADEYLSRLADLLRETLEFSSKTEVSIADEVDFLDNYLSLEKLRFDDGFSFTIECSPQPAIYQIKIPPMVLQPHIENALRHGLKQKQGQSKLLLIKLRLNNNQLICEIEDNGIGRKKASENKKNNYKNYTSKGVLLSESKLKMYGQLSGRTTNTEIIDMYSNDTINKAEGTLVRITINQS